MFPTAPSFYLLAVELLVEESVHVEDLGGVGEHHRLRLIVPLEACVERARGEGEGGEGGGQSVQVGRGREKRKLRVAAGERYHCGRR